MINSVFQQDLEDPIGAILLHAPQSSGAENHSGSLMAGLSKRTGRDHNIPSQLEWFRRWCGSEPPRCPTRQEFHPSAIAYSTAIGIAPWWRGPQVVLLLSPSTSG